MQVSLFCANKFGHVSVKVTAHQAPTKASSVPHEPHFPDKSWLGGFQNPFSAFHCSCSVCSKTDNILILWNVLGHLRSTGNLLLSLGSFIPRSLIFVVFSPQLVLLICISYCKREAGMMDQFLFYTNMISDASSYVPYPL